MKTFEFLQALFLSEISCTYLLYVGAGPSPGRLQFTFLPAAIFVVLVLDDLLKILENWSNGQTLYKELKLSSHNLVVGDKFT